MMTDFAYGTLQPHSWGHVFWGQKGVTIDWLKSQFPQYQFIRARQIHGDHSVLVNGSSDDLAHQADGLITQHSQLALCSITADCVPVLIYSAHSKMIAAIHAGWRGVANRIVPKTIQTMTDLGAKPDQVLVWIGPHIQQASFEVQEDVKDQILLSLKTPLHHDTHSCYEESTFVQPKLNKYHVNLSKVLIEQLCQLGVIPRQIQISNQDTKSNEKFCSARREPSDPARQISFIVLKSPGPADG